jgi:hypothetical protein
MRSHRAAAEAEGNLDEIAPSSRNKENGLGRFVT